MARKIIKRFLPDSDTVKKHKALRFLGTWLHDPNLFHITRRSTSLAFFIGIFMAFMPIPVQMAPAALGAIWLRANLPIAIGLVWLTNPITVPPIYYGCYRLGSWLLGVKPGAFHFELSWAWFDQELHTVLQPLLLGCMVTGLCCGLLGAGLVRGLWRLHVVQRWETRRKSRALRNLLKRQASEQSDNDQSQR